MQPSQVEAGLWVGPAPRSPKDFRLLDDLEIQDVLTLQTESEARMAGMPPELAIRSAATWGIALHRVPIVDKDDASMRSKVSDAVALLASLRRRGRRVYVHCAAGLNRSPTVVAGWLAISRGVDAREACGLVYSVRPSFPDEEAVRLTLERATMRP